MPEYNACGNPIRNNNDETPSFLKDSESKNLKTLSENLEKIQRQLDILNSTINHTPFRDIIPEIAELAYTVPLSYFDVLSICETYGEGYKNVIKKHRDAGEIYKALDEMVSIIRIRRIEFSEIDGKNGQPDFEKLFEMGKKNKEKKLPRKLRKGWS